MQTAKSSLWRIEFRADLTRADTTTIPLGFMLESRWEKRARWLGLIFRKALTPLELDQVNTMTWPELADLEGFMKPLFEQAWNPIAPQDGLGSPPVAHLFAETSALHFAPEHSDVDLSWKGDGSPTFSRLYTSLLDFKGRLKPTLIAPVVPMKPKTRPAAVAADVELMNKAA